MTGMCGWTWAKAREPSKRKYTRLAEAALTKTGGGDATVTSGHRYTLINAGRSGHSSSYSDTRGTAAVYGVFSTSNQTLGKRIDAVGPAAAILEAYESSGADFLRSLSGTYALTIVSDDGESVLVATDQVGSIPVNYIATNDSLLFSTTLRVLRALPFVELQIDDQAIFRYLYFHAIPTPYTAFQKVLKLPPRHWLLWHKGQLRIEEYSHYQWAPESAANFRIPGREADFFQILDRVVEQSIEGESEIGCFLSGGTDSSTLAGVMSTRLKRHTRSYSIGFDEPGYDEMDYARLASKHFETEHHEYYVTKRDVADLLPHIWEAYEEPFGNSSAVPTFFCAQMANRDGIRRLVAGDGGDELFGGNTRYRDQLIFSYYDNLPDALKESLIKRIASSLPQRFFVTRKIRRYVEQAEIPMPIRMFSYNHLRMLGPNRVLHPDYLKRINEEGPESELTEVYGAADANNMIDRMLALDLKFTLTDNDLPKVVTMCDLGGCDVVFPLLMDEMIRFSMTLPPSLKVTRRDLRIFFKGALRDFLPEQIVKKKKHGFGLPFGRWLSQDDELRAIAHEAIPGLAKRGIISEQFTRELLTNRLHEHSAYYGGFAWVLIQLELWYRGQEPGSVSR